ncbi:MAG: ThiF family adenylyltransferase [Solibacillus sp.]
MIILENMTNIKFNQVTIGTGANGSFFVRNSLQTYNNFREKIKSLRYMIVDGDRVENKNTRNQLFTEEDVDEYKVYSLAERYGSHYRVDVLASTEYVTEIEHIERLFGNDTSAFRLLVVCVDNNRTRQLIHEYFMQTDNLLYIDVGVEGVRVEQEFEKDTPRQKVLDAIADSGFSGQVVAGLKVQGEVIVPPVGLLYPDILEDHDSVFPTQSCAETINNPQRVETNRYAAEMTNVMINNLLHRGVLIQNEITFNSRDGVSAPTYVNAEMKRKLKELMND